MLMVHWSILMLPMAPASRAGSTWPDTSMHSMAAGTVLKTVTLFVVAGPGTVLMTVLVTVWVTPAVGTDA
jgi:hypothetical protein